MGYPSFFIVKVLKVAYFLRVSYKVKDFRFLPLEKGKCLLWVFF